MKNKVENEMFDEFDFMYRHKSIVKEKEEERIKAEEEEKKAALELQRQAKEAALLSLEEKEPKPKREKKEKKKKVKKKNIKKKAEKPADAAEKQAAAVEKKEKKVHPKYGKPYKNDRPSDRKRIEAKRPEAPKKKNKKKKDKKERPKRERLFSAERSANLKAGATRFMVYMLIAFAAAATVFAASLGVIVFAVSFRRGADHKNISYQVGLVSDTVRVPYNDLIRNGVLYVCGNDIVNLCGFTVTGTGDEIKYISPDDGNDTVLFYKSSNRAIVNNNEIRLQSETYEKDGKLYIPASFFTSYSTGLVFEYTPETEDSRASLKVYKNILNEYDHKITGTVAVYEPVTFRLKEFTTLDRLDESALADEIEDATYKIDVTPYYDAINPENIYGYISVINADHRATATMRYDDLTPVVIQAESVEEPILLRGIAARALEAMFAEVRGVEGFERFNVYSGYHTFENSEEKNASLDESLLGLSVDAYFNPKDATYANTNTYKWFANNAYKYGFIIRYPRDKTDETGVGFRPWTLRYVGRYAATKMREENLCLEEFIAKYNLERVLEIKQSDR